MDVSTKSYHTKIGVRFCHCLSQTDHLMTEVKSETETKTLNYFSGQFFWIRVRIMSQACVSTRQKKFRNAFFSGI